MTNTREKLSQGLVTALDELLTVHYEQERSAEMSRQQAQASHTRMMQMLQTAQFGDPKSLGDALRPKFDADASLLDHASMLKLHRRWTVALTNCDGLLMRLYAYSEAQESAEKIAGYIKALRLIDVADEEIIAPPAFDPTRHLPDDNAKEDTPEERKQRKIGMALDFFSGMDDYLPKVQQGFDAKTAQTTQLLKQAKEEAERLLVHGETEA